MITTDKKSDLFKLKVDKAEGYLHRALQLIDSNDEHERMKGYSLVYARFDLLSPEVRNYIRKRWAEENEENAIFAKLRTHFQKRFKL
ncbi:MAG: hypothetical protein ACTSQE_12820 [Candidatus Heimdallarchaeaceae archaeon]